MEKFILAVVLSVASWAMAQPQVTTNKTVEERLAELEANQSLRYVNLSGLLISTYDNIGVTESFPKKMDFDRLAYWRLRFSLNVDAEVNPQIRVYSRFTTTKFMNTWRTQGGSPFFNEDIESAYANSGSHIFLEKAYVDLSSGSSDWTVSVGRLPTVHGTPVHFLDLLPRQGTYPFLSFNAPLDGVGLTYRLDNYLEKHHRWALRFLYTPFSDVFWGTDERYLRPPKEDVNGTTPVGQDLSTVINMWSAQSDYEVQEGSSYFDNLGLIFQHYRVDSFRLSSRVGTSNANINLAHTAASMEVRGVGRSNFDLSWSYALSETMSQGLVAPGLGFGTDQNHADMWGGRSLLSLRYRWAQDQWAVGIERVDADKNSFHYSGAPEDLTGFYLSPGVAHHLYIVKKWMNLVTIRGGYRQQDLLHYSFGLGPVQDTDRQIKTFYVQLRTDF